MGKTTAWVGASFDFDRAWSCTFMRDHADASRLVFVRHAWRVNVHVHTLKEPPKRKVSASWSLATTPRAGFDPRQGREILGQAEPYQKWHSYAFRDLRCLKKPWKREHRCEYMHERPKCRSKFPEQTHSFSFPGESVDIIRLISKEMECSARKKTAN